jgi:ribose transport system permease protein
MERASQPVTDEVGGVHGAVIQQRAQRLRRLGALGVEAIGITTFFVAIVIYFSTATHQFLTYSNTINILSNVSVIGMVSIGQTLVIISGGFDLSVSGTVPLGAVVYASLTNSGLNPLVAMIVIVGVGAVVGLANGLVITRVGINPLITTLGTLSITGGLAQTITGGLTTTFTNPDAANIAATTVGDIPNYVWVLVLLSIGGFLTLRYTVFGRSIYAMGGNREASRLVGMRVDLITIAVYMLCGALASFAGIVVASELLAGSATLGNDSALSSIAAVILGGGSLTGGIGGVPGTLVGVLVLGTIANGMALMQVPAFYQQIATGAILLLAVGFGRLRTLFGRES